MAINPLQRFIPLQGCFNFRDLGGYETRDGRAVRSRTLFRSDSIHSITPDDAAYVHLETTSERLQSGLARVAEQTDVPLTSNRVGSMMTAFFAADRVTDYAGAAASDTERFGRFFHGMLECGVYLAPSQFEANFVSTAHTEDDIQRTLQAADEALGETALTQA